MDGRRGAEEEAYQLPSSHSRSGRNAFGGLEALAGILVEDIGSRTRHNGKRELSRPLNGPCFVYVPKVENGTGCHRLSVGRTMEVSCGDNYYWRTGPGREELQRMINNQSQVIVDNRFNYDAFAKS